MTKILYIVFHDFEDFEFFYDKIFSKRNFNHNYYSARDVSSDYKIEKDSKILPMIALIAGIIGILAAVFFQFWTSASDYPLNLSGKPFFSFLISIPITFEFMVFISVLAILVSFLFLSKSKIKEPDVEKEIKKLISEGKSVLKVEAEIVNDDFFRMHLIEFMQKDKIVVNQNYD
ncbi:MAG: DUF3341 domain-containing protein [Candidatus Kapabacteria bacterium]|nr:DUF3341 domain-containing protein [Candidatus Kapabacteria bacterium]